MRGIPGGTLLQDDLIAAMKQVGELYEKGKIFVPEILVDSPRGECRVCRAQAETCGPEG